MELRRESVFAGETEGARRATGVSRIPAAGDGPEARPEVSAVEVQDKATRRKFSAEYKLRILKEAEACKDSRSLGGLLRREGLYHSSLSLWRKQQREGTVVGLGKRQGRKGPEVNELLLENKKLRKENEQIKRRLAQAELIIDVQKKISQILGIPLQSEQEGENS